MNVYILNKIKEVSIAVLGINVLVWGLALIGVVDYSSAVFIPFIIASVLLAIGQTLFLSGAENSIMEMGKRIGNNMNKFKKIWIILAVGFLFGVSCTLAEPDMLIFVNELVSFCPNLTVAFLLLSLSFSVGSFVILGFVKIFKHIKLKYIFFIIYGIVIVLSFFSSPEFLGIAFDASGVSTGAITVPILLSMCAGITAILPKSSTEDSRFGMLGIASSGPVVICLIMGIIYKGNIVSAIPIQETLSFGPLFLSMMFKVFIAILPITLLFLIINFVKLKYSSKTLLKLFISLIICYFGLVIFLTSVNYGFAPMGNYLGEQLSVLISQGKTWIILIIFAIMGMILVFTEPAIVILTDQVYEASHGALKKRFVYISLGLGISIALVLSCLKIIYGISTIWLIVPLVVVSVILSFFINDTFVGIAFDSGGVATGTMLVAFAFPICLAITTTLSENILLLGFGTVALVALIPVICIEIMALIYKIKSRRRK